MKFLTEVQEDIKRKEEKARSAVQRVESERLMS